MRPLPDNILKMWTAFQLLWPIATTDHIKDALMRLRWEIADRGYRIYTDARTEMLCIEDVNSFVHDKTPKTTRPTGKTH